MSQLKRIAVVGCLDVGHPRRPSGSLECGSRWWPAGPPPRFPHGDRAV